MNLMENAFRRILPIMLAIVMTVLAAPLHITSLIAQTPQPGAAIQRPAGGEANLVIPDLTNNTVNVTFFGMSGHTLLMSGLIV